MNTERHPLQPFLPKNGRILMLGSFPPKKEKWSMDFFYPNWINDMWRIMGHIFYNDKEYFIAEENGKKTKRFDREKCVRFAGSAGIAMFDTAREVRRLKDNASDKFLEIVTPTDIEELLKELDECQASVTTGQKATDVICSTFGCTEPSVGSFSEVVIGGKTIRLWRMPSSSRAYPLAMEKKAEYYRKMYEYEKLI